jgi:transposase-like protein
MRWTSRRKAELIDACSSGERSLAEVLVEHAISPEEFAAWVRLYESGGGPALRSTKLQNYRKVPEQRTLRRRPGSPIISPTKTSTTRVSMGPREKT